MVVFIKSGAVATKKQPIQFDIDRFSYSLTPKQTHPNSERINKWSCATSVENNSSIVAKN
jgi:hypothetical protein